MDTFIDKLAQKISAQDMIRANLAAEAKETKKLREKMESYESLLQEMRQINLKNMESAERVNQLLQESEHADKEFLQEMFAKTDEAIHTENVKVYRNVQAAVSNALEDQTKLLIEEQQKQIEKQHELIAEQGRISKKRGAFLKAMVVLIFLGVAADITLHVLEIFGIF